MADYTPTNWQSGMPITAQLMNHIELGIQAQNNSINTINTTIGDGPDGLATKVQNNTNAISNLSSTVQTAATQAQTALTQVGQNAQGAQDGSTALAQLQAAEVYTDPVTNLVTRWDDTHISGRLDSMTNYMNTSISDLETDKAEQSDLLATQAQADRNTNNIGLIQTQINNAAGSYYNDETGQQTQRTLKQKIDALDYELSTHSQTMTDIQNDLDAISGAYATPAERIDDIVSDVSTIQGELDGARIGNTSLDDRLDAIDGGSNPSRTLPNVITELNNSHMGDYTNLNARLNRIDGGALKSGDTARDIVDLTGEVNDAHRTNDDTLSARFGAIDTTLGGLGNADTTLGNRITPLETQINGALRTDLVDDQDQPITDTLDNRFDDIEARATALETTTSTLTGTTIPGINTSIGALTTGLNNVSREVGEAHRDHTGIFIGEPGEEEEVADTLAIRFAADEDRIDTLEDDLNTAETGLKAKVATIESDLNTAETGLKAKVSTIESDLNTTTTGLKDRVGAIEGDLNTATTGIKAKVSALETTVNDSTNGVGALATRVSTLESAPRSATVIIEADCITYSEQTGDPTLYTNNSKTTTITPSADVDYLLGKDDKYYYWKYIGTAPNGTWNLISGGGGGEGTSSAIITTTLPNVADADLNTDYYVGTPSTGYTHYKFTVVHNENTGEDEVTAVVIGQNIDTSKIKRYNIYLTEEGEGDEAVTYLNLYQYDYEEASNGIDTDRPYFTRVPLPKGGGGGASSTNVNKLTRIGDQTIQTIVGSQVYLRVFYSSHDSAGEESNAGTYTLKTGNTVIETGTLNSGAFNTTVSGWQENTAGYYQFDVSRYCKVGNTSFTLQVEVAGVTLTKPWTVNIIDLHLETTAPTTLLLASNETYDFPYTPFGALSKTLHVVLDDVIELDPVTLVATTSGRAATFTIDPADFETSIHGAHKIEMYLTATVGGVTKTTESIIREYIWYDVNDTETPIILASPYDGETISAQQYSTIEIPYQVYQKGADSINVYYYEGNSATPYGQETLTDTNTGTFTYLAIDETVTSLTITVEDISITINLNITALPINVSPVTGAIIDFDPTTYTNNSVNRLPSWTFGANTYKFTASSNFNWSNDASGGGYKEDEDGKCFVIKAGSYIDLDYPMFANNVLANGAEMKVIFKTTAVRNANAIWYKNIGETVGKTVGIQLSAHAGWLKTDKATDTDTTASGTSYDAWAANTVYAVNAIVVVKDTIYRCTTAHTSGEEFSSDNWLSVGKIDTGVLATNSYLYFPYSEEDKIELDININKYDATAANNFIMSYEDGVPSKAYAYSYGASGDGIQHSNTIRIGSDDCDVHIYHLRIYNKALGTDDILQNFIADGRDIDEKVSRYNRNCIYWDPTQNDGEGAYFTSPSITATLDPVKLAERIPDVKVLMLDTPVFTTGKKNFVRDSTLRCVHAQGGKIYKSRGDADNWYFTGGFHSGQGTTSDNYGQSDRNVDFLFEVDGTHWPTKSKNMKGFSVPPDYQSKVYIGEDASEWVETEQGSNIYHWVPTREATAAETCDDWKGDNCKIALTETSVPNNYFNLKVNVASSENVNNALFQKRYDDFLVYNSPAYNAQITKHGVAYRAMGLNTTKTKVKNSMEFVPAVLFVRENDPDISKHTEFQDTEWHFYALGNIGDSKKTDYTRAYDPDDMNEFTCENSDNNTNNGQFQSGVFIYNNEEAIETDYAAWTNDVAYENGAIVIKEGRIYQYNAESMEALEEGETTTWVAADWTDITPSTTETLYYAPRTNPNPMDYIYPIDPEQWNVKMTVADSEGKYHYVNRKHDALVEEDFDGDHSFEFRYACCGDYRDGDLINDTTGLAKAQFTKNHDVMLAMYEWLVTSTNAQYKNEAEQWFVKSAMEFFYAYTHYYTMMDNRAKNTFWHFAKTGIHRRVTRPVEALYHVYEVADGTVTVNAEGVATGNFKAPEGEFDPNGTYYTQYAFDLWAYDMDTAAGIDNNGALVFPYGKEDGDYRVEGEASSGYAFNGAGSIFWRRLKSTFEDEIATVMNNADAACFNSEDLIEEFDNFQNCFPEEIWRLDIERKYIRTFTGASVDNSVTIGKQNPRFLKSMMQGRKKYQRRQWIRDQGVYFNSKYRLSDITRDTNTAEFNIITPANPSSLAVTPSYNLQLTPYQDMYLNVTIGNGGPTPSIRAKAGVTYTLDLLPYSSGTFQETRLYIYGFNHISGLGNLAPMYPYAFTLSALDHLKVLNIGTENNNYVNANFTELPFSETTKLPLLETLNVKNCSSLAGSISLNTANNIRTIEATGTAITGVTLPDYTNITTLHLPSSVTSVSLYGARMLEDFSIFNSIGELDYTGLYKLYIYDSDYSTNINWLQVASDMLIKESLETEIELLRLTTAHVTNIEELEPFNIFKATLAEVNRPLQFSGTINVNGNWSTIEKDKYEAVWPITINTDNGTEITRYEITYKYDDYVGNDGNLVYGEVIRKVYVASGSRIPDIFATGLISEPTRDPTVRYTYMFGSKVLGEYVVNSGWKAQGASAAYTVMPVASSNMVVETYFTPTARVYPVKWYMKRNDVNSLVTTSSIAVEYNGGENLEAPTVADIHAAGQQTVNVTFNGNLVTINTFNGWEKLPINITPAATDSSYNIYATWKTTTMPLGDLFPIYPEGATIPEPTIEQLVVLSRMSSLQRSNYPGTAYIEQNCRLTYTLGNDSVETGTDLISSVLRFDLNSTPRATSVQPMRVGNNAFTIMIDYMFDNTATYDSQTRQAILMSCYYQNSSQNVSNGFALYQEVNGTYNQGVKIGFGSPFNNSYAQTVGTAGVRNVVVLRHPADSDTLYIYTGLNSSGHITDAITQDTITWNNSTSDAYINFGQLVSNVGIEYYDVNSTKEKASGIIYGAKYWDKDLGVGECKRLAMWPHERVTMGITKISTNATSGAPTDAAVTPMIPAIGLSTLSTFNYGYIAHDSNGWGESHYRTICNDRLFNALPVELQSVIGKPRVKYLNIVSTSDGSGGFTYSLGNQSSIPCYIYMPSAYNMDESASAYNNEYDVNYETAPLSWISNDNVQVYNYGTNNTWTLDTTDNSRFMNLRFPMKPINSITRVFREVNNSFSNGNTYTILTATAGLSQAQGGPIKEGDVFIDISGNVYIYITNSDARDLGMKTKPESGIFATNGQGGWLEARGYWLRSLMVPDQWTGNRRSAYVVKTGTVYTVYNQNTAPDSNGLGINYSITI